MFDTGYKAFWGDELDKSSLEICYSFIEAIAKVTQTTGLCCHLDARKGERSLGMLRRFLNGPWQPATQDTIKWRSHATKHPRRECFLKCCRGTSVVRLLHYGSLFIIAGIRAVASLSLLYEPDASLAHKWTMAPNAQIRTLLQRLRETK